MRRGDRYQTLQGITGSGKTATIAWMIEQVQRPTLIIEPNKSLAAQLSSELRDLFPKNRVEFFVSYYDYYQPEAYLPDDGHLHREGLVHQRRDRPAAPRHDVVPAHAAGRDRGGLGLLHLRPGLARRVPRPDPRRRPSGEQVDQRDMLRRLVDLQYARNDVNLVRGTFRARGDTVEIHPAYEEQALRVELFGDTVERIVPFDVLTGEMGEEMEDVAVYAATHYVTGDDIIQRAVGTIEVELRERLQEFEKEGKLLEAQRLRVRTEHDLEMLAETGVCSGVENYSRHLDGRAPGETPYTLLDFFPKDYLCVIDESHVAVPQLHGQYAGDRSRKDVLVEHGFRLPSAKDNRPLRFDEFVERVPQASSCRRRPGPFELEHSDQVVEQVIRPTGLVDPEVTIMPTKGQVDDLLARIAAHGRGRRARPGDDADQEDGRGPDRLPGRRRRPGAVPALGHRHHHPDRDPARAAARLHRRAGRHQPAARGPRPARGGPGRHPRRRQGGLPALGLLADPDHGPGRPQRRRHGRPLRRHRDRLHARGGLGDPAPPRACRSPTTGSTGSTPRPSASR